MLFRGVLHKLANLFTSTSKQAEGLKRSSLDKFKLYYEKLEGEPKSSKGSKR